MELNQLRYFVAVAEERHFTRAAERLEVAQPSVSSQIRKLEEELGSTLFDRGRSGASLTQAGETLLPLARRVLSDLEDAEARLRELDSLQHGRLSIGATPSLSTVLLPAALAEFHAAHPGVTLSLFEEGSGLLVQRLVTGEIELGLVILPQRHPGLSTTALATEELVVVAAPDHRLAGRRGLTVSELQGVPLVMFRDGYDLRSSTLEACHQAGFEPALATEGGEMDGVLALVAAGLGAAVVPSIVAGRHPELATVRFVPPVLQRTIGLARRADRSESRAAAAFLAALRSVLRRRGWPGEAPTGLRLLDEVGAGRTPGRRTARRG
ncbi:MAG TPA: LysR substrate-binding domain-containing protein [Acidimicrobiales bacterium]|nr:LysR substrate-binding domain-containing protein [Acidimicrobiales bacterium]